MKTRPRQALLQSQLTRCLLAPDLPAKHATTEAKQHGRKPKWHDWQEMSLALTAEIIGGRPFYATVSKTQVKKIISHLCAISLVVVGMGNMSNATATSVALSYATGRAELSAKQSQTFSSAM